MNIRVAKAERSRTNIRKYCFINRIVNIWNGLPNNTVSANTTNVFTNRLDKFWQDQEIIYHFGAQSEGTGSTVSSISDDIDVGALYPSDHRGG